MTNQEMTKIFSVLLLAYPNAEMFKGGIQKLEPTIKLWTRCNEDVDFWTGQQATFRLCRECKYPPTIAEFREKVRDTEAEMKSSFASIVQGIRSAELLYGSLEVWYAQLPAGPLRQAIEQIGGIEKLQISLDGGGTMWNWNELEAAYMQAVRSIKTLPPKKTKMLP